ncbi:MAG: hypothetical protein ACK474_18360, partial [Pseudanabaena sp.]
FLVLNKCDQWDNYKSQALEDVKEQWKQCLGVDKIYAVCALGYDKQLPNNFSLDIRGVNELREDIEVFLELEGKKLLLARHMGDKKSYAQGIIVTAVTAVGVQALLPGKAFYSGIELTKKDTTGILKDKFNEYRNRVGTILKRLGMTDIRNLGSLNFKDIIDGLF